MSKAVMITPDQFNELRSMSTQLLDLIKLREWSRAIGRCGDLANALIDIENHHLDSIRPLGPTENIGSCEPSPLIQWDKTQSTWHTDTKAGRYSVRRVHKRGPFGAFLNGKPVSIDTSLDLAAVKRAVELRIIEARRIANMSADDARKALIG